ncbi:MAG TPA: aminodeoxychorismate synthase component I [Steroidobacteraceae bacterium]|nr:aminodeoxychorismate synthase component I [Steroidobacteraceae bacterium]
MWLPAATPQPSTAAAPSAVLLDLHEARPERYPVLLESVGGGDSLGRYDVLLALPEVQLLKHGDGRLTQDGREVPGTRFLDALDDWWRQDGNLNPGTDGIFSGGWFLYLSYELAAEIEPRLRLHRSRQPQAIAWRVRGALVRDRETGLLQFCAEDGHEPRLRRQAEEDIAALPRDGHEAHSVAGGGTVPRSLVEDLREEDPAIFLAGVRQALAAIGRGDVYQVNLSRAWSAKLRPEATEMDLYRYLRIANPAPFAGIARLPGFSVLSSSPERLLRVANGVASTRPIAGTRPRGPDAESDESLKAELWLNEKERAEHIMLVDLERNDLGRVCKAGSVRVDELMTIETYAHVHHIVSNVRGELRPEVTPGQAIAAVFPGGTITGCPKVRCMELLAELEPEPRGAYTGSMGYLGLDGSLDLNILIRTMMVGGGIATFRTGGGIVADSRPEPELAETRAKARGLLAALEQTS